MILIHFSYVKRLITIGALTSGKGSNCNGDSDLPFIAGIDILVPSSFAGSLIFGVYSFSVDLTNT